MQWNEIGGGRGTCAWGREDTYLVLAAGGCEVRLTRYTSGTPIYMAVEAARNVIVFPLGRGPGRPAGEPELAALTESAKRAAERFEAGQDIEGYPAWQHGRRHAA